MLEAIGILGISFGLMFGARWLARKHSEAAEAQKIERMDANLIKWSGEDELKSVRK